MDQIDKERLTRPFPRDAIKQREAQRGGKKLDYVEGHTVIHRLNEATGNRWDFKVLALDRLAISDDWTLVTATVELTIPGLGSRQHIGVQSVHVKGEDMVKGAITDALKKAATLFGVGLELYGPDYEAGEIEERPPQNARPNPPQSAKLPTNSTVTRPLNPATDEQMNYVKALGKERGAKQADGHTDVPMLADLLSSEFGIKWDGVQNLAFEDAKRVLDKWAPIKDSNAFYKKARELGYGDAGDILRRTGIKVTSLDWQVAYDELVAFKENEASA